MNKRKVKIREGSWLARIAAGRMGYGQVAMVIGHTIHLHNTSAERFLSSPSWVLHELKHVQQYEQLGVFVFLWKYLAESIRKGYYNNAFEVAARAAEKEYALLEDYDLSAYSHLSQ